MQRATMRRQVSFAEDSDHARTFRGTRSTTTPLKLTKNQINKFNIAGDGFAPRSALLKGKS